MTANHRSYRYIDGKLIQCHAAQSTTYSIDQHSMQPLTGLHGQRATGRGASRGTALNAVSCDKSRVWANDLANYCGFSRTFRGQRGGRATAKTASAAQRRGGTQDLSVPHRHVAPSRSLSSAPPFIAATDLLPAGRSPIRHTTRHTHILTDTAACTVRRRRRTQKHPRTPRPLKHRS